MSTTKLCNDERRQICVLLLNHRFGEQEHALREEEHELAVQVRADGLGTKDLERIEALPAGWVPERSFIRIVVDGHHQDLKFRDKMLFRVPDKVAAYGHAFRSFTSDEKIGKRFMKWKTNKEELARVRRVAEQQVTAFLNSCTTPKVLVDKWPEAKPFVDRVCGRADDSGRTKALAMRIEDLNTLLGLRS